MTKKSKITVYVALATVGSGGKVKLHEDPETIRLFLEERSDAEIGVLIRNYFEDHLEELKEESQSKVNNVVSLNQWREKC